MQMETFKGEPALNQWLREFDKKGTTIYEIYHRTHVLSHMPIIYSNASRMFYKWSFKNYVNYFFSSPRVRGLRELCNNSMDNANLNVSERNDLSNRSRRWQGQGHPSTSALQKEGEPCAYLDGDGVPCFFVLNICENRKKRSASIAKPNILQM
jgi:hypothetical protein